MVQAWLSGGSPWAWLVKKPVMEERVLGQLFPWCLHPAPTPQCSSLLFKCGCSEAVSPRLLPLLLCLLLLCFWEGARAERAHEEAGQGTSRSSMPGALRCRGLIRPPEWHLRTELQNTQNKTA